MRNFIEIIKSPSFSYLRTVWSLDYFPRVYPKLRSIFCHQHGLVQSHWTNPIFFRTDFLQKLILLLIYIVKWPWTGLVKILTWNLSRKYHHSLILKLLLLLFLAGGQDVGLLHWNIDFIEGSMLVLIILSHPLTRNVQVESFLLIINFSLYLLPISFLGLFQAKLWCLFLITLIGAFLLLNGMHVVIRNGLFTQSEVFP